MVAENAADRASFFETDDFGVTATYNGTTSVDGIFDDEYFEDAPGIGPGGESSKPTFLCRTADVAAATQGQTLVVNGATYHVASVHPDGAGMTLLVLEKQ